MPGTYAMTNKQHMPAGVTILDEDGQPFTEKPEGYTLTFASDKPEVAEFTVGPDGLNGDIASGLVGTAKISADVNFPDGSKKSDFITINVTNSAPGVPNFTAGTPVSEE